MLSLIEKKVIDNHKKSMKEIKQVSGGKEFLAIKLLLGSNKHLCLRNSRSQCRQVVWVFLKFIQSSRVWIRIVYLRGNTEEGRKESKAEKEE